jgi:hypothetical protein
MVDEGGLRNKPPTPREVWLSTDSRRPRRRLLDAVLSSNIIVLIRPTNFKISAPPAADDDDDADEDADRAMIDTDNGMAPKCKFFIRF